MDGFWDGDPVRPLIVGHRGVRRPGVVENTMAAFELAVAEGADAIELDVRRSADGVAVIHHDPETASGTLLVETRAAQLQREGIVLLCDVLDALPPRIGLDLEIKNLPHEPDFDETEALVGVVAQLLAGAAPRRLLGTSFSPYTVAALAEALPDMQRGLVTLATVGLDTAAEVAAEFGATVLCPQLGAAGLDEAGVQRAHDAGMRVMVWELGAVEELVASAATGVDAVCVDDPERARSALARLRLGDDRQRARHAAQLD